MNNPQFSLEEIIQLNRDMMEEEIMSIGCTDEFIERLMDLRDKKLDAFETSDWFKTQMSIIGNTPPNTDGEGEFKNPNV